MLQKGEHRVQEDLSIYHIIEAIKKMKASIAVLTYQMAKPELILQESKILYAKQAILFEDEKTEANTKQSFNDMLKFLNRSEKKNLYCNENSHGGELIHRLSEGFVSIFRNNSRRKSV